MEESYLIDVRSSDEYTEGHVTSAHNIDVRRLASGELPNIPKSNPIQVYCASGARSALAKRILEAKGYTDVTDLGGIA
jgi:phage shock protein E